jgi:hypothetical protein
VFYVGFDPRLCSEHELDNWQSIIATYDVFLAFTMVQQIMAELSVAATEKVAVITKSVFILLNNNANSSL